MFHLWEILAEDADAVVCTQPDSVNAASIPVVMRVFIFIGSFLQHVHGILPA